MDADAKARDKAFAILDIKVIFASILLNKLLNLAKVYRAFLQK